MIDMLELLQDLIIIHDTEEDHQQTFKLFREAFIFQLNEAHLKEFCLVVNEIESKNGKENFQIKK
jgi:hypothetical protein